MKVPMLRYDQPGASFYACSVPAADIVGRLEIRPRSESQDGIQRDEDPRRVRQIESYLRGEDAVLPTPIVVSAYFERISIQEAGFIEIKDGSDPIGHILDGQHRVLGLRRAGDEVIGKIQLLVVFVFEIEKYAQATIFSTINSNQRQVSKSLIYDLFGLDPKRSPEKVAHEVVKSLNDDANSPFFRRIKILGKKVEETETLSQAAFVDALLGAMRAKNSRIWEMYEDRNDWAIQKVVANCFCGLLNASSRETHNYPADYFLKTTGYGGVMKALNQLVFRGWVNRSITSEYFCDVFSKYFRRFSEPPKGTGNAAMIEIAKNILLSNGLSA